MEHETRSGMPAIDPPMHLANLLAFAIDGNGLDDATREWLRFGILGMIQRGGSLDRHLGLKARTGRLARFEDQLWSFKRALHLSDAMDCMALNQDVGSWEKAKRLVPEIERFTRTWSITRHECEPDPSWPAVRQHLWLAASTGQDLPTTAQGIYKAIDRTGLFSDSDHGHKMLTSFLPPKRHNAELEDNRPYRPGMQ